MIILISSKSVQYQPIQISITTSLASYLPNYHFPSPNMKYTTSIVSLLLAAPSTILAAPSPASAPKVSAREPSHLSVRDYDGPQPACMGGKTHSGGIPIGSGFGWTVYIPQPIGLEDKPGFFCGDGFLDNLRGQGGCETPTSYGCDSMDVEKKSDGSIIQGTHFDCT